MDKTQSLSIARDRVVRLLELFQMSSIMSLDHEIVQLPDTIGVLWVCQTSQRNWVAIKVHYRYLRKVSVELARIETGICHSV